MLSREAIHYLRETGINPHDRVVEFSDIDGRDRTFIIDNNGHASEVPPTNFRADEPLVIHTLKGLVDYIESEFDRSHKPFILQIENEETISLNGELESDGGAWRNTAKTFGSF